MLSIRVPVTIRIHRKNFVCSVRSEEEFILEVAPCLIDAGIQKMLSR